MFIVLTNNDLVTRAFNTDHIVAFTLTDAGWHPPYVPQVSLVLRDGVVVERLQIPTVDQPTPQTAEAAVHHFFHEVLANIDVIP